MAAIFSRLLSKVSGIEHSFSDPRTELPPSTFRLQQVHSAELVELSKSSLQDEIRQRKADGMYSSAAMAMGVQTGDCLPTLFAARSGKWVAAVHAGWRGLNQGILVRAVEALQKRGVHPKDLLVAIGPAIGKCCFEVSRDVIEAFEKDWGHLWSRENRPWYESQPKSAALGRSQAPVSANNLWVDLDAIARLQLTSIGIPNDQIEDVGHCTYCGPGELASYRRSTHDGTKAGRQWSTIGIKA